MTQLVPEVQPAEAARLAASGQVLLLDVREHDEWSAGHAAQATHVRLGALDVADIPRDRPVVAVCRSGNRSGNATQALVAAGIDARNLAGGMKAWAGIGLPIVTADGRAGEVI